MNNIERFYACMNYQPVDRHPFWCFGAWQETVDRWKTEGYDPEKHDLSAGSDPAPMHGAWFEPNPPFERTVIEETGDYIIHVNSEGVLIKEFKTNAESSMPQFIRFPVATSEDFRLFWKERMQPDLSARIGPNWQDSLMKIRSQDYPFIVWGANWGGFFGPLRWLLGVENLCMMFYDDPDFVEEMMDAVADLIIAIMGQILDVVDVDCFQYWEDMAYNAGPLLSPSLARRYMLPRYMRVNEYLSSRSVKFIGLDSDGQIGSLIPIWMDSGINYLFPFEVQCGMDVLRVRREYGRDLRIVGGVDKRTLARGPEAINAELARVRPLIEEGGYIPMTDHTVPPDVSFDNYNYYLNRIAAICGG